MVYLPLNANIYTLCLIVGFICASGIESVHSSQKHKLCGPKLTKVLTDVCSEFPTLPPPNKRMNGVDMNDYNSLLSSQDWQYAVEQPEDSHMFAMEKFNEFIPDRFMLDKRNGIVEECCKRGCTYEYLIKNYCANW
ncbi:probable insulin-like peptide 2 [Ochlerotatus camptorhynchus]|uniref:probable insulin-like peptide 2 n=1 Tax=Ochlerotatus camptorhynchus TaxID=644619 RepID=UPI0031D097EC